MIKDVTETAWESLFARNNICNMKSCNFVGQRARRRPAYARQSEACLAKSGHSRYRDRGKCDNKPRPKAPIDLSLSQFLLLSWDQMALAPSWRHSLPSSQPPLPPPPPPRPPICVLQ